MASKKHEVLQEDSTTGSSENDLDDDGRITAYESDASDEHNDDAGNHVNVELEKVETTVVEDNNNNNDNINNNENVNQNGVLTEETLDDNNIAGQSIETRTNGYNNNNNNNNNFDYTKAQFHGSMYRISQLLNSTTTSFLMYFCLTLNGIIFFIGCLSNTRNLGRLWFRADYSEVYEYSFGWYKSSELEGDWTPVGYSDLDGYFDTNIVDAGDFFGVTCIFGLVLLIVVGIISMCMGIRATTLDNNRNNVEEENISNIKSLEELQKENRTSKLCSGTLLGLSVVYFLVYVISILTFHTEFEDVCGELIGLLDSAHRYYHKQNLDHYECDDGWALYLQYANIFIYVLSMVLYYELQKSKIAIQIAQQIKYLDRQ